MPRSLDPDRGGVPRPKFVSQDLNLYKYVRARAQVTAYKYVKSLYCWNDASKSGAEIDVSVGYFSFMFQ